MLVLSLVKNIFILPNCASAGAATTGGRSRPPWRPIYPPATTHPRSRNLIRPYSDKRHSEVTCASTATVSALLRGVQSLTTPPHSVLKVARYYSTRAPTCNTTPQWRLRCLQSLDGPRHGLGPLSGEIGSPVEMMSHPARCPQQPGGIRLCEAQVNPPEPAQSAGWLTTAPELSVGQKTESNTPSDPQYAHFGRPRDAPLHALSHPR